MKEWTQDQAISSKVFHSFRATANDKLKQNAISEETRCEFVGHDYDTINSKHYIKKFSVKFLHDKAYLHFNMKLISQHWNKNTKNKKVI